jgi:hypothetical protein
MTTKITITHTILDGNLGDGWRDVSEVADALADYISNVWEEDLTEFSEHGYNVQIDISVQYNTSGYSGSTLISIDDDGSVSEREIENALTPMTIIWDQFCASQQATELSA